MPFFGMVMKKNDKFIGKCENYTFEGDLCQMAKATQVAEKLGIKTGEPVFMALQN